MDNYLPQIYRSFMLSCVVAFIIAFFTKGNVSFGALLAGYCLLILSIALIITIILSSKNEMLKNLLSSLPFFLLFGIIGFLMYLTISNMRSIIANHVSPSYSGFVNITLILLLIIVYIVYQNITSPAFINTGKISNLTTSLIYLFGLLALITSLILFTILTYFKTDG